MCYRLSVEAVRGAETSIIASKTIPAVCKCMSEWPATGSVPELDPHSLSLSHFPLGNVKYSVLRHAALQVMDKITATLADCSMLSSLPQTTITQLSDSLSAITDRQSKTLAATVLGRLPPPSSQP